MDTPPEQFPVTQDISQSDLISCDDMALAQPPASPEVKFLAGLKGSMSLLHTDKVKFRLALEAVEPLTHECFRILVQSYEEQHKALILAVIQERDVEEPTLVRAFFFAAGMLNRLIFKQSGETLISRYSGSTALTPNNPLTNLPIISEVEFYICQSEDRAVFIGSDYTLWKRPSLQEVFKTNSQWDLDEWQSAQDSLHLNDLDANSLEALSHLVDVHRAAVLSVIRIPFLKAVIYGILVVLMALIYCASFALSLNDVIPTQYVYIKQGWSDDISPQVVTLLPVLAITSCLFDWLTCTLFQQNESPVFFHVKIVTWMLMVLLTPLVYFVCEIRQGKLAYLSSIMGYAGYHTLYSGCLFMANCKYQRPE